MIDELFLRPVRVEEHEAVVFAVVVIYPLDPVWRQFS